MSAKRERKRQSIPVVKQLNHRDKKTGAALEKPRRLACKSVFKSREMLEIGNYR
jgi:hypothetical protein